MAQRIAILGWGSLLWDNRFPDFDAQRGPWLDDGPEVVLEFSRVSGTRNGALTLVIDPDHGVACRVAYAISKRDRLEDAINDLRIRESTPRRNIGFVLADGSRHRGRDCATREAVCEWCTAKKFDAVVWTDLNSNFADTCGAPFSIDTATSHIQALEPEGKAKAAEYVWRAPQFVSTPLRAVLQTAPWFPTGSSTPK